MRVLCAGQGFAVRKDMDHFSQLIHSMYTVHPHHTRAFSNPLPVPERQECFSFVGNELQSKKSNLIPGLSSLAETCPCCGHKTPKFSLLGYLSRLHHDTTVASTSSHCDRTGSQLLVKVTSEYFMGYCAGYGAENLKCLLRHLPHKHD